MLPDKNVVLPDDLKKLSKVELESLADEIRERLVDIVANNGGHLASNLGVVELTIAMYTHYNPFVDKIVWDVGHQTYVHKI
ncbi:MAG: 1-deoxy-D-xylulose-5-phosphate synthase, partial [Clostridia bacterium]|nr:1-deoxy-D-xylulose-5-phosphate synthase [Clostridia bacterium]